MTDSEKITLKQQPENFKYFYLREITHTTMKENMI